MFHFGLKSLGHLEDNIIRAAGISQEDRQPPDSLPLCDWYFDDESVSPLTLS